MSSIALALGGQALSVKVKHDTPLLWLLSHSLPAVINGIFADKGKRIWRLPVRQEDLVLN